MSSLNKNHSVIPPFDTLVGQQLAAEFLSAVISSNDPKQTYLFVGPLGAGKTAAAQAFCQALLCEQDGNDNCDSCLRVIHGTHPDVHIIDPMGTKGYLTEQIRELLHDSTLAPVRAKRKIYIITRADLLKDTTANALLKTLEEPPQSTIFILLARTRGAVLDTILSRCAVLAFRRIPEPEAIAIISKNTGASPQEARIALAAAGGSLLYAQEFWLSHTRRDLRIAIIDALERLPHSDDAQILEAVKSLLVAMKAPLDSVKLEQQKQLKSSRDYLGKGSLTRLEQQHKRELTSRERQTIGEALDVTRSWLRDIMLIQSNQAQQVVNIDFHYNIELIAKRSQTSSTVRALEAVSRAQEQIQYNVNPQLALEVMLFAIREEFL
jgi:DNA polymerase-3 subunit delta'